MILPARLATRKLPTRCILPDSLTSEVRDSAGDKKFCGSFRRIVQNAVLAEAFFSRAEASSLMTNMPAIFCDLFSHGGLRKAAL